MYLLLLQLVLDLQYVPTSVVLTSGFEVCTNFCCSFFWIFNMYHVLMYLLLDLSYVPSSVVVTSVSPCEHLIFAV